MNIFNTAKLIKYGQVVFQMIRLRMLIQRKHQKNNTIIKEKK